MRRHLAVLLPLAAAFFFLPQLLFAYFTRDLTADTLFAAENSGRVLPLLVILLTLSLLGQLTMTMIVAGQDRGRTIGALLAAALALLLPALAASLIQGLAVGFGLLLLIVPGLWLLSRLILVTPVIACEVADPIAALKRSWALTEGQSLKIIGMLLLLFAGFILVTLSLSGLGAAIGVISTVAAGQPDVGWGVGRWLYELSNAGISAAIGLLYLAFIARLYLALSTQPA